MADERFSGPVPPYGVAIREAMAGGDQARMHQVQEAARQWLKANAGHEKQGEVHAALRELEGKLGGTR